MHDSPARTNCKKHSSGKGMTGVLRGRRGDTLKNTMGQEGNKAWRRGLDQDQTRMLLLAFSVSLGQSLHLPTCSSHSSSDRSPACIISISEQRLPWQTLNTGFTTSRHGLAFLYPKQLVSDHISGKAGKRKIRHLALC